MSSFLATFIFALVLVALAFIGLGIGKLLTGKSRLDCKRCGNPEKKEKKCGTCGKTNKKS